MQRIMIISVSFNIMRLAIAVRRIQNCETAGTKQVLHVKCDISECVSEPTWKVILRVD